MLVGIVTGLAFLCGLLVPLRWGVPGFLGTALALYIVFSAALALRGFEGLPLEDSLLLFEGSTTAYLGFNLQVAYRAFALPVLMLAAVFIFRQRRVLQGARAWRPNFFCRNPVDLRRDAYQVSNTGAGASVLFRIKALRLRE